MIRKLDTDATVRGGSAKSRRMHVAEGLHGARARGTRFIRLRVSIARLRLGCFYSELRLRSSMTKRRRRGKKEEVLLGVLLIR